MFSSAVCCADSFYDLSTEAKALYFQLGFEADNDGVVMSIRSVARKCNFDKEQVPSLIAELVNGGYLLEIFDTHLIVHWWANNNKDKYNYSPGGRQDVMNLVCEDPDTRTYRLITGTEETNSLSSDCCQSEICLQSKVIEENGIEDKISEVKEEKIKTSKAKRREGAQSAAIKTVSCPKCGTESAVTDDYGSLIGWCPQCKEDFTVS